MEIKNYSLNVILPNPYQTRESEDPQHIKELAESIQAHTMLQIPSARASAASPGKVELAFGHSRLAAYRYLNDAGNEGYDTFPLNVVEMNDQQMFEAAVTENRDRKDLTPIEEAKAMLRYRDEFHKTSEEIGKLFNLSDSAVRNKIRLLELPAEVQAVVGVTITENAAREIVSVMDLPSEVEGRYNRYTPEKLRNILISHALEGESSEQIQAEVVSYFEQAGERMDKKHWKNDDDLVGEGIIGRCAGCAFLQKRKTEYCLKPECYKAKEKAWKIQYLSQASLLSGILVHEKAGDGYLNTYSDVTNFSYGNQTKLKYIRKAQCENLRLIFDELRSAPGDGEKITHLVKEGFPSAMIVCAKRSGHCTCMTAIEKGIDVTKQGDAALAEQRLKEMHRQIKEQTQIDRDQVQHLAAEAAEKIIAGLNERDFKTWAYFLKNISYKLNPEKIEEKTFDQLIAAAVESIVTSQLEYVNDNPKHAIATLNNTLTRCGLEQFEAPQEQPDPEPQEVEAEPEIMEEFQGIVYSSEVEAADGE